jgi:hypothetical protein
VIGFGARRRKTDRTQLKQVNVDAISYNTCNQQYGGDIINELMLCVERPVAVQLPGRLGRSNFNADGEQVGAGELGYWLC